MNGSTVFRDPCVEHFGPGTTVNLSDQAAQEVFRRSRRVRFKTGEVLLHAGERGGRVLFVCEGRVSFQSHTPAGNSVLTSTVGRGGIVGLGAAFDARSTQRVTARAMTDTQVRQVRSEDLLELCAVLPDVGVTLARAIAQELGDLQERVPSLVWDRAELRVRAAVARLVDRHGRTNSDGLVWLAVAHDEIAGLAGVARPTASSVISEAVKRGVLVTSRRYIGVADRKQFRDWTLL